MNTSRYGRVRKPSDIAKACAVAFYFEEAYVNNFEDYIPLADFMWKNFEMSDGKKCYAFEDDYPGQWHTQWTFQGLARFDNE